MLTKEDVDKYVELQELILSRIKEVASLVSVSAPTLVKDYSIEHSNVFIRGRFSFPASYLYESDTFIIDIQNAKKKANEDRLLGIKKANAIEGYKENLELVELAKKELVELGVDPETIKAD